MGLSDGENTYLFAGYRKVLGGIYQAIMVHPRATVLDVGFGTGMLTAKLYEHGCTIDICKGVRMWIKRQFISI